MAQNKELDASMTTQLSPLQLSVLPNAQMNPAYSDTSTMVKNATYCNTLTTRSSLELLRRSNTYNNKEPGEITLLEHGALGTSVKKK
jgi:hypothetical protein